jgi:hypothetical protein
MLAPMMAGRGRSRTRRSGGEESFMDKFLIEVEHESETFACARAVKMLFTAGAHFITHTDWGCKDGVHKGWIVVELDSKEEARSILPPAYRAQAKIVKLNKFSLDELDELLKYHAG